MNLFMFLAQCFRGRRMDSHISDEVLFLLRNLFNIALISSPVCVIASFLPGAIAWSVARQ